MSPRQRGDQLNVLVDALRTLAGGEECLVVADAIQRGPVEDGLMVYRRVGLSLLTQLGRAEITGRRYLVEYYHSDIAARDAFDTALNRALSDFGTAELIEDSFEPGLDAWSAEYLVTID